MDHFIRFNSHSLAASLARRFDGSPHFATFSLASRNATFSTSNRAKSFQKHEHVRRIEDRRQYTTTHNKCSFIGILCACLTYASSILVECGRQCQTCHKFVTAVARDKCVRPFIVYYLLGRDPILYAIQKGRPEQRKVTGKKTIWLIKCELNWGGVSEKVAPMTNTRSWRFLMFSETCFVDVVWHLV